MGEAMRGLRAVVAVAAIVALTASAEAQMGQSMLQGGKDYEKRGGGAPPPHEKPTKRANEKDYKSSLERLPDQKYDPWAKTR
jgi:hypothetical protein